MGTKAGALKRYANWEERFWPNVDITSSGCMEWQGSKRCGTYGQIKIKGNRVFTHRASWMLAFGDPGKYFVLHHCDNPLCVNPAHLFLGDCKANHLDRAKKMRNGLYKLTKENVFEILKRYTPYCSDSGGRALAREYKVAPITIMNIIHGRKWSWLTGKEVRLP